MVHRLFRGVPGPTDKSVPIGGVIRDESELQHLPVGADLDAKSKRVIVSPRDRLQLADDGFDTEYVVHVSDFGLSSSLMVFLNPTFPATCQTTIPSGSLNPEAARLP